MLLLRSPQSCWWGTTTLVTSAISRGQIQKHRSEGDEMEGDAGLRFYVFDEIADEKAFETAYALPWARSRLIRPWPIASWRRPITPFT